MQDRIEKSVELKAPTSRVWRALTDHEEFGEWFRVKLDGPFVLNEVSRGVTTYPGYEGMKWEATVVAMERERLFAFKWCPYEHDDEREHHCRKEAGSGVLGRVANSLEALVPRTGSSSRAMHGTTARWRCCSALPVCPIQLRPRA